MPTPPTINVLTITRSKVRLLGNEEEVDPAQEQPMGTKTKVEGQPSSPQSSGAKGRSRALLFLAMPPNAFQIILERIDGLREVQNENFNRLNTIQEQINLLAIKFDSFTDQP